MRQLKSALVLGSLGLAALLSNASPARAASDSVITGTGMATIDRQPDTLRMQLQIVIEGKDAKEALAKLDGVEAAARKKLATFGAVDATIEFAAPEVDPQTPQRRQMEMMSRQQNHKAPQTRPVTLGVVLKAEWPLKHQTAAEAIVASTELEKSIKDADLAGAKAKTLTPAEEENQEEANGMSDSDNGPPPGEPTFIFVSKISDDDQAKATAEAFKSAKANAARLAKAAGADLGALAQLRDQSAPDIEEDPYDNSYARRYMYTMMQEAAAGGTGMSEAIGTQPGKVTLHVMVTASFAIK